MSGQNTGSLPTLFRCKVGGEWKPLSAFSSTQLKFIERRPGSRGNVDAANSGMTCREHSAGARTEIRCEVCNLIKPADCFSRSSRRRDEPICKRCGAWEEVQEPGVTPFHLETGHISIEEELNETFKRDFNESTDFFDDDDDEQPPSSGFSSLSLQDGRTKATSGTLAQKDDSHAPISSAASVASSTLSSLPPHLRPNTSTPLLQLGPSNAGQSGLSTPSGYSSARSDASFSSLRAATIQGRRAPGAQSYNAWDPTGNLHRAVKTPTVASASEAGSQSSAAVAVDGWGQRQEPEAAKWEVAGKENKKSRKGGWAKAPRLTKAELCAAEPAPHVNAQVKDPGLDAQMRMNYCQSEDSNY
ncbi:hypothetical protein HIM_08656 [Hirsutella minnesotensis 3608]|uniref:Stc1 domain-containing protein n=1 Tax=Hirsutella minnesotensis 3608 TaxID=1043627 RepID=A0A0F7ZH40_9HYPO|nr:hypothetical protein HIM_08656 [Hirsutella minnesotensis 3608]